MLFNVDDSLAGLSFYYEVEDTGGTFCWVECWASLSHGAGELAHYYLANYASERRYDIYGYAMDNEIKTELATRPYINKDSATKWLFLNVDTMILLARSQQEQVKSLNNLSKFYVVTPPGNNPIRYDFNNNIWVLNPQTDYGVPPVMETDTFYKFDTITKTWVPNV
jgi:hypothetical protein